MTNQCDARGRLEQVASGTGADERIVRLKYDSTGYVNKLIDPLGGEVLIQNGSVTHNLAAFICMPVTLKLAEHQLASATPAQSPKSSNHRLIWPRR